MRTLNIAIPLDIVNLLSDDGNLNPIFIREFITKHDTCPVSHQQFTNNLIYSLKVPKDLFQSVTQSALDHNMSITQYTAQYFKYCYRKE